MNNDLISRKVAIDALYHVDEYNRQSVEAIRNLPSAQPERKKGRWVEVENRWGRFEIKCSECGAKIPMDEWGNAMQSDYCYRCGADMRGEEE